MAKDKDNWRERLEAIGKREPDETSKRIMAGIEASKKRNKELVEKRTQRAVQDVLDAPTSDRKAAAETKSEQPESRQKSSAKRPSSRSNTSKSNTPSTRVRTQKGGAAESETVSKETRRQLNVQRDVEEILNGSRERKKSENKREAKSSSKAGKDGSNAAKTPSKADAQKTESKTQSSYKRPTITRETLHNQQREALQTAVTSPYRLAQAATRGAKRRASKQADNRRRRAKRGAVHRLRIE